MLLQVGSVTGCSTGCLVNVERVVEGMIVVLNDGELWSLLDVWTEWILGCVEDDVLYMVASSNLRSALVSLRVVLYSYSVCVGVDVALMSVVMLVCLMCVRYGDL